MMIRDLIKKLQELPGDYVIGRWHTPNLNNIRFQHMDAEIGVNNETRRVAVAFTRMSDASMKEIREAFEL